MAFLTVGVPFFWDDHQFNEAYVSQTSYSLLERMFDFSSESALSTSRSFYALIFKSFFYFFGYNVVLFRLVKAVAFAFLVLLVYSISKNFIKNTAFSAFATLMFMFSFPIYMHTLIGFGPFLWAELLKLALVMLFVQDLKLVKTSKIKQLFILLLAFLMLRAYNPTVAILLTIFVYVFINPKIVKRYFILCLFFLLISFPFSIFNSGNTGEHQEFNPINLYRVFLGFDFADLFVPDLSLSNLYYKPFLSIITVFVFWLLLFSLVLFLTNKLENCREIFSAEIKRSLKFLTIWCFAEASLFLFLFEHAIRYISAFLIPFYILLGMLLLRTYEMLSYKWRKYFLYLVVFCIFSAIMINLSYSFSFRAGWSSNFIAREKVASFFLENNILSNETEILYFSEEVADSFLPLNVSNFDYKLVFMDNFKRSKTADFNESNLKQIKDKNVYVVKLITAGGKAYPNIDLLKYKNVSFVAEICGRSKDGFDKLRDFINNLDVVDIPYSKFEIYKVI